MNTFKITFADGNAITTGMNATLAEATAYYIGNRFQFGDTEAKPFDHLVEAVSIEEIKPTIYHFTARGREKNAIGVMHNIHATFEADSFEDFKRQVYERFEHVAQPIVTRDGQEIDFFAEVTK